MFIGYLKTKYFVDGYVITKPFINDASIYLIYEKYKFVMAYNINKQ